MNLPKCVRIVYTFSSTDWTVRCNMYNLIGHISLGRELGGRSRAKGHRPPKGRKILPRILRNPLSGERGKDAAVSRWQPGHIGHYVRQMTWDLVSDRWHGTLCQTDDMVSDRWHRTLCQTDVCQMTLDLVSDRWHGTLCHTDDFGSWVRHMTLDLESVRWHGTLCHTDDMGPCWKKIQTTAFYAFSSALSRFFVRWCWHLLLCNIRNQ